MQVDVVQQISTSLRMLVSYSRGVVSFLTYDFCIGLLVLSIEVEIRNELKINQKDFY